MQTHRRTGAILLLATAIGFLVIGGFLLYLSLVPLVTVSVAGDSRQIRGRFGTVAEAIEAAGLEIREEDVVWPSLVDPIPSTGAVIVHTASPVQFSRGGESETVWTHQNNLASFLAEQGVSLKRTTGISVDNLEVPLAAISETRVGQAVTLSSMIEARIDDETDVISVQTQAATVGQLLAEQGIEIYGADNVEPRPNSWLEPEQEIMIERATPVTVSVGDRQIVARTSRKDVADVLAEAGVGLIGRQQSSPALDQPISGSDTIVVQQPLTTYELTESVVPYSSSLAPQDTLEIDQRSLISAGAPGIRSQLTRIDTSSAETISQTIVAEWISQPPIDEVIGYGTNVVVRSLDTPNGPLSYWRVVRMRATAYTAADAGKSADHPSYGITASGRPAGFGVVAVDPTIIPFRSQVYVPGYGIGFAGDTGGGVKGRWIDLGYDDGEIETWNGYVDVYYLTPAPEPDQINYFIPTALP